MGAEARTGGTELGISHRWGVGGSANPQGKHKTPGHQSSGQVLGPTAEGAPSMPTAQQALTDADRTGRKQTIGLGKPQTPRPTGKQRHPNFCLGTSLGKEQSHSLRWPC